MPQHDWLIRSWHQLALWVQETFFSRILSNILGRISLISCKYEIKKAPRAACGQGGCFYALSVPVTESYLLSVLVYFFLSLSGQEPAHSFSLPLTHLVPSPGGRFKLSSHLHFNRNAGTTPSSLANTLYKF